MLKLKDLPRIKAELQEKLTIGGLRSRGRKFIGIQEYPLPDNTTLRAYVFEKDLDTISGQATLYGTIILNSAINSYPTNLKNYILLHERGHLQMNLIISTILVMLIFASAVILLFGAFPLYFIAIIGTFSKTFIHPVAALIMAILFTLPFVVTQCLNEGYAEYKALQILGIEKFESAYKEMENIRLKNANKKKTPFMRFIKILHFLSYPPKELTIAIYKMRHMENKPTPTEAAP